MHAVVIQNTTIKFDSRQIDLLIKKIVYRLSQSKELKNKKRLDRLDITIVFVSSMKMKQLNHQFRQKDYATDILSFDSTSKDSLGELILCPSVLKKQAKDHQHSLDHEITYMLIHGVLHLLGYDHESTKNQEKKMFLLQDRLFSQLTRSQINLKITYVHRRRTQ